MIQLKATTYNFRGKEVIHRISFTLNDMEHAAIAGPTASGKSMLLRALAGRMQPTSGSAYYEFSGTAIDGFSMYKEAILISFQEKSKYFDATHHYYQQRYESLEDEYSKSITVQAYLDQTLQQSASSGLSAALQALHIEDLLQRKLIQLSSGQRKKLALVPAIVNPPKLLLLDDPYMGLDAPSRDDLNRILTKLASQQQTQIIIASKEGDLPGFIKKFIRLDRKSAGNETEESVSHTPFPSKMSYANPFKTLVQFKDISVTYGKSIVLNKINFHIKQGSKQALIGNNGSGKSTLLSLIYADHPQAYANDILLFDRRRGSGESIWEIKQNIGFSSPELHLYFPPGLTGLQVIGTGFFTALALTRPLTSNQQDKILEFANYFEVGDQLPRPFGQLSTGEQRTLLLIRALVSPRPLVLLDEPYQGMDARLIEKANRLMNHLFTGEGSLLFITHYEDEIPSCIQERLFLENSALSESR